MAEPRQAGPLVYAIAAHRGFADALVAGIVPRYREAGFGLARLTLLVPSSRAANLDVNQAEIERLGAEAEEVVEDEEDVAIREKTKGTWRYPKSPPP